MTIDQYSLCLSEVPNYTSLDSFVSDLTLSSIWGDADNAAVPPQRISDLSALWVAAHRGIKEIASVAGISVRGLSRSFALPVRTAENWAAGKRPFPIYVSMMMQESLGLLGFKIER